VKQANSTIKIWILIYQCDVSRALHTELVENYSGTGLVNALRTVFATRNTPVRISADPGRNIIRAKALMSSVPTISNEDLQQVLEEWPTINWQIHPTAAPWRSGGAEAMVKQVKSSLRCLQTSHLSTMEFRTVLAEITTTINNRPLGVCPVSKQPLTPNQLLLGRNYSKVAPEVTAPINTTTTGLAPYLIAVYNAWWDRWRTHVLPYMFTLGQTKWKSRHPNLKEDQVCLLLSSYGKGSYRTYKYCKILKTHPNLDDGLVRRVTIQYFNHPSPKPKTAVVDVRRLVLLPHSSVQSGKEHSSTKSLAVAEHFSTKSPINVGDSPPPKFSGGKGKITSADK
jgi:hypothetical protein